MARNDLARLKVVIEAESSRLTGQLDKVNSRLGRFEKQINRRAQGITTAFRGILGAGVGLGAGAAIASGLRRATEEAATFEEELSKVKAVTGATGDEIEQLEQIARRLGATTKFSAQEAARGVTFLGQAGFETGQILKALPATLNLAAAGGLGLNRAADIASNVLSGFRLEAEDTTRVVDAMAKTAASSNTSVEQLAEAFKKVGPVAASLGISVETTAAAIGTLGQAGLQAELAGTGLKTVFAALTSPMKAAKDALGELGLTAQDVNPQVNDLDDIVQKLVDSGLDAEKAFKIFGREGATAILALTSQAGEFKDLEKAIKGSTGAAEEMARVMGDNLRGDSLALQSSISELALTFADRTGLLGGLRAVTQELTEFNRGLASAVAGTGQSIDQLRAKITDLRDVTKEFGPLGVKGGGLTAGVRRGLIDKAETQLLEKLRKQTDAQGIRTDVSLLEKEIAAANEKIAEFKDKIAAIPDDAPKVSFQVGKATIEPAFKVLNQQLASATGELERLTKQREEALQKLAEVELDIDTGEVLVPPVEIPISIKPKIKSGGSARAELKTAFDELQAEANRLSQQLQTPNEAFEQSIKRFDTLRDADKISAELHSRAIQDSTRELFNAYEQSGPQEAFANVTAELNRLRDADLISFNQYASAIADAQDQFTQSLAENNENLMAFAQELIIAQNPAIELAETLARIDAAFGEGFIDAQTRLKAINEEVEVFNQGLEQTSETANEFGESAFKKLTSSLEDAVFHFTSLRDLAKGLAADLGKLAFRELVTQPLEDAASTVLKGFGSGGSGGSGGGIGGLFKGLLGALPGFSTGTEFTVGPSTSANIGGVDNRVVAMRVQDGERVTVTPRDGAGPNSGGVTIGAVNVYAKDINSFRGSETQIAGVVRRAAAMGARNS